MSESTTVQKVELQIKESITREATFEEVQDADRYFPVKESENGESMCVTKDPRLPEHINEWLLNQIWYLIEEKPQGDDRKTRLCDVLAQMKIEGLIEFRSGESQGCQYKFVKGVKKDMNCGAICAKGQCLCSTHLKQTGGRIGSLKKRCEKMIKDKSGRMRNCLKYATKDSDYCGLHS